MTEAKKPCCAKCGADSNELAPAPKTIHSLHGFLIYCKSCGAIVTWVQHHSTWIMGGQEFETH